MLSRIDRVQLAVPDATMAAEGWIALLGAERAGEDRVAGLAARRTRLRAGTGWVELLSPDGAGPVADAVASRGAHLYAAGAATPDLASLRKYLEQRGVDPLSEGGQLHLDMGDTGIEGLRVVVSEDEALPAVGDIDFFYEVTLLSDSTKDVTRALNALFGLDDSNYTEIVSDVFGYRGTLTLFERDQLHRLEVIEPTTPGTTMDRYFRKFGQSLYMAFAETSRINLIAERAAASGAGHTIDRPETRASHLPCDQLWLHPKALGGMMLGLSRPSMAWAWSGHPERVESLA
ncbi:hypothetical protein [Parvibaculum sp.]|jgi:hypothetical protein|uniref:hypothetical protein n=1 Tax=Parvibaculum sp. TaxID=2024848 RepID=UPI000C632008|nr:hypothetical protein [Parvibaculum sp.]MAU59494.1 hypothetical protein [Parvibaculum sp.]MBO6667975.1 hypothetical protein [Parvibaculum sp.]MBO6690588.1 hypothetical protein [Parvibaculum sp.]MBO6714789.1 hypothetical protein [Parvibaculum sp.]|tara:strand:- start:4981 stop:5847 length:867 start_codon:yes stop_codon:yes gene_type:complete